MKNLILIIVIFTFTKGGDTKTIQCGKRGFQNNGFRIINGTLASKGEFPWLISLSIKDANANKYKHNCGGAIISDLWILTAAHCVFGIKKDSLLVIAGANNIKVKEDTQQSRSVIGVFVHNFDKTFANDIALLKLESPLEFGFGIDVMPICLPQKNQQFIGNAVVAGWGSTESEHSSDLLHFVEIPLVDKTSCDYNYIRNGFSSLLNNCQICAGSPEGGKDACQGDSGGPLICTYNGENILCGLVSWGIGCGKKEYPGIYTKVSCYMEWIENNLIAESI